MSPAAAILALSFFLHASQEPGGAAPRPGPWSVLGPFDCPGALVAPDPGPEKHLKRMRAGEPWPALEETFAARDRAKLGWRGVLVEELPRLPAGAGVFDTGTLDLRALLGASGANGDNAVAYLYREIEAPEARAVELACGSDDAIRLWLDGELVLERQVLRALSPFDERLVLELAPGKNHLLVKVTNAGGPWSFAMIEPRPATPQEIDAAIDRGVEWLLGRQLIDGSWRERQEDYPSGVTALVLYTLLESEVSPDHPAVLQAIAQLEAHPAARTYSLSCQTLAVAALRDPGRSAWLERMTEELLGWQRGDGGWSYPGDQSDLSNTQYAALALRAAAHAGIEVPGAVWSGLASFALRHQENRRKNETDAGFVYTPGDETGETGSMTTAGIAVLAMARSALGEGLGSPLRGAVDGGIEAGLDWLGRHWSATSNPNKTDFHLYYLYGLERVGALLELAEIGPHSWYDEGAEFLVRTQEPGGAWAGAEVETCFALLFLARATSHPLSEERDPRLLATPEGEGSIRLRARSGTPATLWIDPPSSGRELARVEFFVRLGEGRWTLVEAGSDTPLAVRHPFAGPGTWEVRAEALLADGERLASPTLVVPHEAGISPARLAYASDGLRNRMGAAGPEARASSAAEPAAHAADDRPWTRWLCAADDADPWIEIELGKSLTVARILLSQARTSRGESPEPRVARAELWLDRDKRPRALELDPDPGAKTVVELDPPQKLARIRLRVVGLDGGELGRCSVGFSEIELQEPGCEGGQR